MPVPVHVGHPRPDPVGGEAPSDARQSTRLIGRDERRSLLEVAAFDWSRHGIEPRWLGMESGDCAAALNPSIFWNRGASELERFLAGAVTRDETALVVSTIGNADDDGPRHPFASSDASITLPGGDGYIGGERLPVGAQASLAPELSGADRDLALRLLNGRPANAVWWQLSLAGYTAAPGGGGPEVHHEPAGKMKPILLDGLGHPVVAAWIPPSGRQRWYVLPDATDWHSVLDWLVRVALPEFVPGALRRARSSLALDPALLSRPGATETFLFGIPAHDERGRCVVLSSVEGFEFCWGNMAEG